MYRKILVPLENTATDRIILDHVKDLAKLCSSEITLIHVADGFVARNQEKYNLSESEEMLKDKEYLIQKSAELSKEGLSVSYLLLCGDPTTQILRAIDEQKSDLVAMATHGHGALSDLVLGTVAESLRHRTSVPILMIRAPK